MTGMWSDEIFRQIVAIVLGFLFVSGLVIFILRKSNIHLNAAWASVQSWLIFAPLVLLFLGLQPPAAHILLAVLSVAAAKLFFKMTGMFHRSNFVWATYAAIIASVTLIHLHRYDLYLAMPMILFGFICLIPLYRNSYKRMIQYIGLTHINYLFLWGFMHVGFLLTLSGGTYLVIFVVLLTELSDTAHVAFSRFFGRYKIAPTISTRRSVEGFLFAVAVTILLAWGLRHLLPHRTYIYWLSSGVLVSLVGGLGDMVMTVIRRDLGVKVTHSFIIGRSDYLTRIDRLIFVAPLFYHLIKELERIQP